LILNFSNSFFQAKADRLQTYPKFLPIRYHTQPQYTSSHPFSPSSKITARRLHPIHHFIHFIHFIHFTTKYTSQAFSYALPHPQGGAKLFEQQSGINWRASSCVSGTILTEPSSWGMCFANAVLTPTAVRRAVRRMLGGG